MDRLKVFLAVLSVCLPFALYYTNGLIRRLLRFPSTLVGEGAKDHSKVVKVGLISASHIAKFAAIYPARKSYTVSVRAVATRTFEKAQNYANENGIPKAHKSFDDLLNDEELDAVYISTPSNLHFDFVKRALEKNKHVLVEKPMVEKEAEALELGELAKRSNLVLMEAMHYRHHPMIHRVKQLVTEQKEIGAVKSILARFAMFDKHSYGFGEPRTEEYVDQKMFDRWVYCLDAIRFISDPVGEIDVKTAKLNGYRVSAEMSIPSRLWGTIQGSFVTDSKSFSVPPEWDLYIEGTKGSIFVKNFGFPFIYHRIDIVKGNGDSRTEKVYEHGESTFEFQMEAFAKAIKENGPIETGSQNACENLKLKTQIITAATSS